MLVAGIVTGRRGLAERRMPAITFGMLMLAAGCDVCGLRPSLAIVALGTATALAGVPVRQLDVPRPAGDTRQVGVVPPTPADAVGRPVR
jgi:hypothetical protein